MHSTTASLLRTDTLRSDMADEDSTLEAGDRAVGCDEATIFNFDSDNLNLAGQLEPNGRAQHSETMLSDSCANPQVELPAGPRDTSLIEYPDYASGLRSDNTAFLTLDQAEEYIHDFGRVHGFARYTL